MIKIKSLASGSSGNCYHVTDGSTPLLLECGISFSKIKKGIDYKTSELAGVLISHEHGDHCKAVEKITRRGIDCYMSQGTADELELNNHRINLLEKSILKDKYLPFVIDSWIVQPFETKHDSKEPVGYFIHSKETKESLVFITDSFYSEYTFSNLNYIMIECNYALDILNKNVKSGRVHPSQKKRVLQSHFSLENVKQFLRANDLSQVEEIWLLHLSSANSDEKRFKKEIQELTGKVVKIAD